CCGQRAYQIHPGHKEATRGSRTLYTTSPDVYGADTLAEQWGIRASVRGDVTRESTGTPTGPPVVSLYAT
ncbi:hypothetical protein EXIGLDRAFT_718753, partial [Exidia glandulosa HHB12029]